jgi:uncharacterized damage-inducible protein DinB
MIKKLLSEMIEQNKFTCAYSFDQVSEENRHFMHNKDTSSIGFIFRHIGEIMNMYGYFFGIPTDIKNTTMGKEDTGDDYNLETSREYIEQGYALLQKLVDEYPESEWLERVDTPFFGKVSKIRLFSHVLYHNSHHAGQISLTLNRGRKI